MNSRIARIPLLMLACLLLVPQVAARANLQEDPVQAYIDAIRIELAEGKVRLISGAMRLSDEEAGVFWPLYHEYEIELFEIGDRRLELIKRFVTAHEAKTLDDLGARQMAEEWFTQESARLELLKKYHRLIGDQFSPLCAIQFVQIEHRINMVIDIMIASELPLFRHGAALGGTYEDTASRTEPQTEKENLSEKSPHIVSMKASWQGDYPVDALDRLPAGQRDGATGYIGDARTFASVWRVFKPDETVPQVDFKRDLVLFARNVRFYNRTRIGQVQVKNGVLEVLALETMSAHPIEDKVAMSLAVVPRKGVKAIQVGERQLSLVTP